VIIIRTGGVLRRTGLDVTDLERVTPFDFILIANQTELLRRLWGVLVGFDAAGVVIGRENDSQGRRQHRCRDQ
jgi:hypothetical protein